MHRRGAFVLAVVVCMSRFGQGAEELYELPARSRFSAVLNRVADSKAYCGVYSLYLVAKHRGAEVSLADVARLSHLGSHGTQLGGLMEAARALSLWAEAVAIRKSDLALVPLPAVAHGWLREKDLSLRGHFFVLFAVSGDQVQIIDAPSPPTWIPMTALEEVWDGKLLLVSRSELDLTLLRFLRAARGCLNLCPWFAALGVAYAMYRWRRAAHRTFFFLVRVCARRMGGCRTGIFRGALVTAVLTCSVLGLAYDGAVRERHT